jgi:streptogramin lyase
MVVTNRDPSYGGSSVTKFAADIDDCVDQNDNDDIETSFGPLEVLPFGEDECMLWNTPLGPSASSIGARATAWDGSEDPDTGEGGHVFIGAMVNQTIYKLDGDTGEILDQAATGLGHYGGAVDGQGNFWTVAMFCTVGLCQVERTSVDDLGDHTIHNVHCGYGISVDAEGRVWTGGMNMFGGGGCISRLDDDTLVNDWVATGLADFNRGIAVGTEMSEGSVWAASTNGDLIQVDLETVEVVKRQAVGVSEMVGVAVDFEGYVWTVSQGGNSAHKVDVSTDPWTVTDVPIGLGPYTYSDMTGMQLKNVTPIE